MNARQTDAYGAFPAVLPRHSRARCHGFTLLELLAVIALIGAVAIGASLAMDGLRSDTQARLAKVEMLEIKKALQQFKRDVGHYPTPQHPADLGELILGKDAGGNDLPRWNPDSGRGWRGPYLAREDIGYVQVGDNLQADGNGMPDEGNVVLHISAADPFMHLPTGNYYVWRPCGDAGSPLCSSELGADGHPPNHGRPYYLFDLDRPHLARIVSAGSDGIYGGLPADEALTCFPNKAVPEGEDDLVLCLQ